MSLPEELSASLQKVTINAEAKESTSQRQLLLQEENGAMGEELKKLTDEVSVGSGCEG